VIEPDSKGVVPPAAMLRLDPSYPNPMAASTTIPFLLAGPSRIQLRIHDVAGRIVTRLVDESRAGGRQVATWDGRDGAGRPVANGVYFVELTAGDTKARERLIVDR
jgi:flagellar hook assembly protein FlgD